MRILLFVALLLIAPAYAQENTAPSLDESTKWISEKVLAMAGGKSEKDGSSFRLEYTEFKFDRCSLLFKTAFTGNKGLAKMMGIMTETYLVLGDLDPEKITVLKVGDAYQVKLLAANGQRKIVVKTETEIPALPGPPTTQSESKAETLVVFNDAQMAERIAKAFTHAVTLCRKQKEPF